MQSCLCCDDQNRFQYHSTQSRSAAWMPPIMQLPTTIRTHLSLQQIVHSLPEPYQQILGAIDCPIDDGKELARAIDDRSTTLSSDGTVAEGCGAHAYTLRTECDQPNHAITGAAPTSGDPDTISSLRTEHFGVLAGMVWIWILAQKFDITEGHVNGVIDNLTVVTRLNEGLNENEGHKKQLSTDIDVWKETVDLMSKTHITSKLRHVKGHQDDMHKRG